MRCLQVEVVPRTKEVRRHHGQEVGAVLFVVESAELDRSNLRDGIWLIGGFEQSCQEIVLPERLRGKFRVDTRGAEIQELPHAVAIARIDDVCSDRQVVIDELGLVGVVGENSAHLRSSQENILRLLLGKEAIGLPLVPEIKLLKRFEDKVVISQLLEPSDNRRADESAVSRDVYLALRVQAVVFLMMQTLGK